MRALLFFVLIPALRADERTQMLIDGLAKQADTFQRIAPEMLGRGLSSRRLVSGPASG